MKKRKILTGEQEKKEKLEQQDFIKFISKNTDLNIVEMNAVEGIQRLLNICLHC